MRFLNQHQNPLVIESRAEIIADIEAFLKRFGFEQYQVHADFQREIPEMIDLVMSDIANFETVVRVTDKKIPPFRVLLYQTQEGKVVNFWQNEDPEISVANVPTSLDDLYVKVRGRLDRVRKEDILYVESEKKYCTVVTKQRKFVLRTALKTIAAQINGEHFVRVHRSYIVNSQHINSIDLQNLSILIGETKITIGRSYQAELLDRLTILQ
jgi:hypothetical protein